MSKALLVIDMQEACIGKNRAEFFKYDSDIIDKVNEEIKANENVIYIRNLMKNNFINKLAPVQIFDGDKGAELAEDLFKKGNAVFDKYKGDAFSNSRLPEYLQKNNVNTVEVVGVDGDGCVALTAHACRL
ncbi:MAG: cysteine hydrolase [Candidatus Saccharibacteria bacterium]|nr:cysteine hydrolase [Candidatus Saccharibacteria bacterium]